MISLLLFCVTLGYSVLAVGVYLDKIPKFQLIAMTLILGQILLLVPQIETFSAVDPFVGLNAVSLFIGSTTLLVGYKSARMQMLFPPVFSIVALLLSIALISPQVPMTGVSTEVWVWIHLSLILLGYVAFILGGLTSCMYFFVQSRLKEKNLQGIARYPSLHILDRYNLISMWVGFCCLFTGSVAGVFWGLYTNIAFLSMMVDITIVGSFSLLSWYAVGLLGRYLGRRARWIAWFALIGFCSLTVFFLLSAIIGSWHLGAG